MTQEDTPFDTKGRNRRRARQRGLLRFIDDWFVKEVARGVDASAELPPKIDRQRCAELLREEADTLANEIRDTLDEIEQHRREQTKAGLFKEIHSQEIALGEGRGNIRPFSAPEEEVPPTAIPELREDQGEPLRDLTRLVALLVVADDLAGDYEDPRVKRARNESG